MKGIFSSQPETLMDAISSIRDHCADFNWTIQLQSGPFREIHFTDEDDSRNVLHLFHDFSVGEPAWFKRGVLPTHASNLIQDEWSYYLGFNASDVDVHDLHKALRDDISPRRTLFDVITSMPSVYLMFVDDGWWECYSTIDTIVSRVTDAWAGKTVDSARWEDGRHQNLHPFPEVAK